MNTHTKIMSLPIWHKVSSKTLFFILSAVLVCVFILYGYMVNRTIMNVVARENTEHEIANLSSSIGELEYKYMMARGAVTMDLAYQKGFKDATPSQFIPRNGSELSYNSR